MRYTLSTLLHLSAAVTAMTAASACQPASTPSWEQPPSEALDLWESRLACGGIAGFACPHGYVCLDDPTDDCDPDAGGADCIGVCEAPGTACLFDDRDRSYVSRDPAQCAAILFLCAPGYAPFFDECGCGCEPEDAAPPVDGARCGPSECGRGERCCSESCGICAPLGGSCVRMECE